MLFFSFSSFTLFPYHQASLLLPPSTTSSAVAPPLVPTFPPKPQEWHQGHKPTPARPTPPPACPRLPHGAPCTLGARVLQRARNSTVCVCLRACVLAGWIPPQLCTEPRTLKWLLGAGQVDGRAAFLSQVASLPPTAHHPHQAVGTWAPPTSWEVFFLESMEMAAHRSDSPQAQVETNGGRFSCPNWSQLETPTLTKKTRNEECLIKFKPSSKRHSF